jgi:cellulose synthase operon protein C
MTFRQLGAMGAVMMAMLAGGCATPGDAIDPGPSIRDELASRRAPDPEVLPIIKSEPQAAAPERAVENYRRLLELETDPRTQQEAQRRLADLQVSIADAEGTTEEAAATLEESVALYLDLLDERPDAEDNDRIHYQLARAYQGLGNTPAAIDALQQVAEQHPDSELLGDARFRRAELLFFEARYAEAESEYAEVMAMADETPFHDIAQYKLGWSRYRQSQYDAAVDVFIDILDRELPPGEWLDVNEALAGLDSQKIDYTRDSIRVIGLSFIQLGGGSAANAYFAREGDPAYFPMLYAALGDQLLERQRYTDAAAASRAFIERHTQHPLAPTFQERVIAAHREGGFDDLVVAAKQTYVADYDPDAPYWQGGTPTDEVLTALRGHLGDLAAHFYASGQRLEEVDDVEGASGIDSFLTAADYYRRIMQVYPQDAGVAEMNFMLGESLLNGQRPLDAAREYERTAYDYPAHERSAEAGYAAVLAFRAHVDAQPAAERAAALDVAIEGAKRFAGGFPTHRERLRVLTRVAEDLFELERYDEAIAAAAEIINHPTEVDYRLRGSAWNVTANSHFAEQRYVEAEGAFVESLAIMSASDDARDETVERLAASVYKQGEQARDNGELRQSAFHFLRVKEVAPGASILATADFDGASVLFELEDWPETARVIETFRQAYPQHPQLADADKMLATAYQRNGQPFEAASAYERIAGRGGEAADVRQESAWLAATLFDEAGRESEANRAYATYVGSYPRPVDRAMVARSRLVEMAEQRNDAPARIRWLNEIVAADAAAGSERTDQTRLLAAESALTLGGIQARESEALRLRQPLNESIAARRQAMERAVATLTQAANYGFAEVTTNATVQLGRLYLSFAAALNESERPRDLDALALEQYELLLEEQSFPFEERAIEAFEANLRRIPQGVYDEAVRESYRELVAIAPAIYGRNDKGVTIYESFR